MSAPLTLDDMQRLAARHGGRCISTDYRNIHTELRWRCVRGHEWEATPFSVRQGKWCATCAHDEHSAVWLPAMHTLARERGGKCLSETYVNSRTKLWWECHQGHTWEATPASIRVAGAWCPACAADSRKGTMNDMHALAARHDGQCLSTEYAGPTGKLRWRCAEGHEWITSPARVRNGFWCAICAKQGRRSSRLEDMHLLAASRGGKCLSDTYETSARLLRWECCRGHRWLAAPANIKGGTWCPKCARAERSNHTIGEMNEIARERGGRCLSDAYVNVTTKLEWECARGHAWSTAPMTVLAGHWCPACKYLDQCVSDEARRKYLAVAGCP